MTSYAQLVQAVECECRHRYLRPQDLPKVREVVSELVVNPNTVLKAYKEVEDNGLVVDRPGRGTFVVGTREQVDLAKLLTVRRSLLSWRSRARREVERVRDLSRIVVDVEVRVAYEPVRHHIDGGSDRRRHDAWIEIVA